MLYPEEKDVKDFLEDLGLKVSSIETGKDETPDFYVDGKIGNYVVEVKSRKDSEEWCRTLNRGEVAEEERKFNSDRWTNDIAKKAISQMYKIDQNKDRFWILWISIDCYASNDAMYIQTLNTLFGVRDVYDFSKGKNFSCMSAAYSTFERYTDLCAVIVAHGQRLSFCVNEDYPEYKKFKTSEIYTSFSRFDTPSTHSQLESNGFLSLKDVKDKGKTDEEMLEKIREKYNLGKICFLDMMGFSTSIKTKR